MTPEEIDRNRDFHRLIEKLRNLKKRDEAGPSNSYHDRQLTEEEQEQVKHQKEEIETLFFDSDRTIAVPA